MVAWSTVEDTPELSPGLTTRSELALENAGGYCSAA